jgi:hypothetical protein
MPRKKKTSAPKMTRKIGGKTFKKVSCHGKKTDAKKKATALRQKGYTARVMDGCVYKGPKSKAKKKKRA